MPLIAAENIVTRIGKKVIRSLRSFPPKMFAVLREIDAMLTLCGGKQRNPYLIRGNLCS